MRRAPASSAFSISSLTMEAGRSTTSPGAMPATTASGSARIGSAKDEVCTLGGHTFLDDRRKLLVPRPPRQGAREVLARLDARLIERVDAEQRARHQRLHLEKVEQLTERRFLEPRRRDDASQTALFGERE